MKRTYILLLIFSIATSCNLKEKLQKIEKINSELKKEFKHSEINSTYSFGTEAVSYTHLTLPTTPYV